MGLLWVPLESQGRVSVGGGRTALHQAAINGHAAVVTLLLEAGAQLRVEDLLKVIDREDPPALHRLLQICKPLVSGRICGVLPCYGGMWQCGQGQQRGRSSSAGAGAAGGEGRPAGSQATVRT